MTPPAYFEAIRKAAAERWDQLERDPDLAGPWHQLFKQVQSPRHVLSELLQNADDAGATQASVCIENNCFLFTHNGEDFIEEHFTSLCRFGYSNKRALHTIGFRGIGFKSTFSLGDTVELYTPTLSLAYDRRRFTEPRWIPDRLRNNGLTQIRVAIRDRHRDQEVRKNLDQWLKSPVSLLFFKHIREIRIGDREVAWTNLGPGPVPETWRMALHDTLDQEFLIARSEAEAFPDEALAEIWQERLLGIDQETEFPPCKVEIVLGAKGQLYVVLPTGVTTSLPFACNAPFIQDPARLKIKDPETSPTNRWLLERIGKLAASVMLQWVAQENASIADRSRAYAIFPDQDGTDHTLQGTCASIVDAAFGCSITGRPFLLSNEGELKPAKECVIVPDQLLDVWPGEQITALLDSRNRPVFSRSVPGGDRQKLIRRNSIDQISKSDFLSVLQSKQLPKPESWRSLLKLWAYIAPDITGYRCYVDTAKLRVAPVQGKSVLYAASEMVRLGEKRLLQSENDWDFLAAHLLVLNQNWPRFLSEQRRAAGERKGEESKEDVEAAFAVLDAIGLKDTSDVSAVLEQVATKSFGDKSLKLTDCIQLAQIAAKLGATIGAAFRFATQDLHLRSTAMLVLYDHDGTLEELLDEVWRSSHLLHRDYSRSFTSCAGEEWIRWVSSGRAGLLGFVPLSCKRSTCGSRKKLETELRRRGLCGTVSYQYSTDKFVIEDWDFEECHWLHWATIAKQDSHIWSRVVERVLSQPESFWSNAKTLRALHVATTGNSRQITSEQLLPKWILRLREVLCLPDTRGCLHKPADLLLRTPETEPFMDVEPFVHGELDRETARPLLILLGVRVTPTGPGRLLDCLRALATAERPPVHEIDKWYRRLDQMIDTCSTADLASIKKAFLEEKIILTESSGWTTLSGVFLWSDEEDVPGAGVVRSSVRDLALWRKLEIAERPTVELTIQWLKQLPSGQALSQNDSRRVRALLPRHAARIWNDCGHWLNLAGEWVPNSTLSYALTMQTLVRWNHLYEGVKQKTADLQRLPVEIAELSPFAGLPRLASLIEEKFHRNPLLTEPPARRAWLNRLGAELKRIKLDDESETSHVRARAAQLADTLWQTAPGLEIIPYINGVPAGIPRSTETIWLDKILYIENRPLAKLAWAVSQELGRAFGRPDVADAIKFCFDRLPEFVTEYIEENFTLIPRGTMTDPGGEPTASPNDGGIPDPGRTPSSPPTDKPDPGGIVITDGDGNPQIDGDDGNGRQEDPPLDEKDRTDGEPPPEKHRPQSKPAKPSIMERFAKNEGFSKDGEDRFFHPDGGWIAKPAGVRFWERWTANGELVRNYWPKDHCLELEPLQIEADIWGLIEKFPDSYAFVLSDEKGEVVEITGAALCAMRTGGELKIYPATYRLVFEDGDRSAEPANGGKRSSSFG